MKKILLSVMVVGALLATSCKGEKKEVTNVTEEVKTEVEKVDVKVEEATKEVSNMIDSALEGVHIPKFENEAVTEHLQSYATYAKDYIAAKGDVLKNAKLAKKGVELVSKGKELLGSLDAESAKKFKGVMNAIQSKMAPAK
jgi:PBP1b-binding outer membrane lipoprotein LpoB